MVGPLSGPISGQMAAFREAVNAVPNAVIVDAAFASLLDILRYWSRLPGAFCRSGGSVYITTSRSVKGFWLRDLPVFLIAALARRPIVNHLHGSDFLSFRGEASWLTGFLVDHFYSRIGRTCVPTTDLSVQYAAYPATKIRVVPNFFDPALIATLPKPEGTAVELLYFSNFIASKGFIKAYDATRLLRDRGMAVRLTLCGAIIGTAQMRTNEVRSYLNAISREDWVTVCFAVSGSDKLKVLSRAHVMLLPTRYPTEAAPISLIEGLVAGCYVISTDQGSIPELLTGFAAAIVEPEPVVIAAAIEAWAEHPDHSSIVNHNRALALERYSPGAYRRAIREILDVPEPCP